MLDPVDDPDALDVPLALLVADDVVDPDVADDVLEPVPGSGHGKQTCPWLQFGDAPVVPPTPPVPPFPQATLATNGTVGSVATATRRILTVSSLRKESVLSIHPR